MKHLKSFESMFKVNQSEFTQFWENYICNNCNGKFETNQSKFKVCRFCNSKDIMLINRFKKQII